MAVAKHGPEQFLQTIHLGLGLHSSETHMPPATPVNPANQNLYSVVYAKPSMKLKPYRDRNARLVKALSLVLFIWSFES